MLKIQECNICGIQIFSDIFECEKCGNTVCEDCIDTLLDICTDCKYKEGIYEVSTSYKVEWK